MLDALSYVCMVWCGRPAVFVWLCKPHTIEDQACPVPCHAMPRVAQTSSKPRNHGVCTLYSTGESVQCIHRPLYVLDNNAATHNASQRTAAGRLIALCTYLQPWRGTARGLRSFRACTTTRMQLEGRNVPCKQYTSGLQHVICTEDVTAVRRTLQRLQICSRDTIASSSSSNPRTSANRLTFSVICLRPRYAAPAAINRCNAVIYACLQPTQGLCLKADLNFGVSPSAGRFFRIATKYITILITSSSVFFPHFRTNCSSESRFLRKINDPKTFFFSVL